MRHKIRLDHQTPMAVTSRGHMLVNLAYVENIRSAGAMLVHLQSERRAVFVGIFAPRGRRTLVLQRIDDAAAEIAAMMCAPRLKSQRRR
jgi:hypothetical protein